MLQISVLSHTNKLNTQHFIISTDTCFDPSGSSSWITLVTLWTSKHAGSQYGNVLRMDDPKGSKQVGVLITKCFKFSWYLVCLHEKYSYEQHKNFTDVNTHGAQKLLCFKRQAICMISPSTSCNSCFQSPASSELDCPSVFQVGRKRTAPWGPIDKATVTGADQ
jgi:hypothetical protein